MATNVASSGATVPAPVTAAGQRASMRFLEFFAVNIRNPDTRRVDCGEFLASPIPAYATVPEGAVPHDRARHGQAHPHRAAAMIRRRAGVNAIATKLGNHSFRGTGITAHLKNGGMIERPRR